VNTTTYDIMCRYAGPWLSRPHPWPIPAEAPFPLDPSTAVYAVFNLTGHCCYVGSVARSGGSGLGDRVAEHLGDQRKRVTWRDVWVLLLHPDTPRREVRRIEGVVGAHLGPTASLRLPQPTLVGRRIEMVQP